MARALATQNVNHNIDRNKDAHDAKAKEPNFKVGQTVLLYTPHVQKGLSSKLQRKWAGPYYIVECCQNHTYSLRHADTHVLHKSLVHANRLKQFQENSNTGVEAKHDDDSDNTSQTTDSIAKPIDSPNNSQNDSAGNEETASRAPDHSERGDSQLTIEKVLCSKRYRGKLWYKVKWKNIKKREWIEKDVVPRDMQRDYFVKYTMAGRAKKRKKHEVN